jgi:hypothetical protein
MSDTQTPAAAAAAAAPAPTKESFGEKVLHGLEDVAEFPVKLITWGEKAEKVLSSAIGDQPELKTVLTTLVAKAESIGSAGLTAGAGSGLNLVADSAVLADATDFFTYVKATVVPLIESIYDQVKTDVGE